MRILRVFFSFFMETQTFFTNTGKISVFLCTPKIDYILSTFILLRLFLFFEKTKILKFPAERKVQVICNKKLRDNKTIIK